MSNIFLYLKGLGVAHTYFKRKKNTKERHAP